MMMMMTGARRAREEARTPCSSSAWTWVLAC